MKIRFLSEFLGLILGRIFKPRHYKPLIRDYGPYTIHVHRVQVTPAEYCARAICQTDGYVHGSATGSTQAQAQEFLVKKLPPIMLNEDGQCVESY